MFDLLSDDTLFEGRSDYPPYNIERTGDDRYRITLAVAGFTKDEISITAQQNHLVVSGQMADPADREYLHKGIAARPFEHRFSLEDHVEVQAASLENGLLEIDLVRNIPEAMKSRRIKSVPTKPA